MADAIFFAKGWNRLTGCRVERIEIVSSRVKNPLIAFPVRPVGDTTIQSPASTSLAPGIESPELPTGRRLWRGQREREASRTKNQFVRRKVKNTFRLDRRDGADAA